LRCLPRCPVGPRSAQFQCLGGEPGRMPLRAGYSAGVIRHMPATLGNKRQLCQQSGNSFRVISITSRRSISCLPSMSARFGGLGRRGAVSVKPVSGNGRAAMTTVDVTMAGSGESYRHRTGHLDSEQAYKFAQDYNGIAPVESVQGGGMAGRCPPDAYDGPNWRAEWWARMPVCERRAELRDTDEVNASMTSPSATTGGPARPYRTLRWCAAHQKVVVAQRLHARCSPRAEDRQSAGRDTAVCRGGRKSQIAR
jgi:hypothetical protein